MTKFIIFAASMALGLSLSSLVENKAQSEEIKLLKERVSTLEGIKK